MMHCRVTRAVRTRDGVKSKKGTRTHARETAKHALNLVRLCLNEAVIDGHFEANPARDLKAPKQPHTEDKWTYLAQPENGAVLSCEPIPEAKQLMLQCAIYTGLRQGESWGLHWTDVHLDKDVPKIVARHNRGSATKSGEPCELLLLPTAADALRRWRESIAPMRPVFPAETGRVHHAGYDGGWKDRKHSGSTRPGHKSLARIDLYVQLCIDGAFRERLSNPALKGAL